MTFDKEDIRELCREYVFIMQELGGDEGLRKWESEESLRAAASVIFIERRKRDDSRGTSRNIENENKAPPPSCFNPFENRWDKCDCGNVDINFKTQAGKPYQKCVKCKVYLNPDGEKVSIKKYA